MTRTPQRRAFTALLATVFLLFGAVDLNGVRPCPHHDLIAAAAAGDHPDHLAHGEHVEEAQSAPDAGKGSCTCKRICPGVPSDPLPVEAPRIVAHPVDAAVPVVLQGDDAVYPRFKPFFIHYAQAPPVLG